MPIKEPWFWSRQLFDPKLFKCQIQHGNILPLEFPISTTGHTLPLPTPASHSSYLRDFALTGHESFCGFHQRRQNHQSLWSWGAYVQPSLMGWWGGVAAAGDYQKRFSNQEVVRCANINLKSSWGILREEIPFFHWKVTKHHAFGRCKCFWIRAQDLSNLQHLSGPSSFASSSLQEAWLDPLVWHVAWDLFFFHQEKCICFLASCTISESQIDDLGVTWCSETHTR